MISDVKNSTKISEKQHFKSWLKTIFRPKKTVTELFGLVTFCEFFRCNFRQKQNAAMSHNSLHSYI